MALVCAAKSCKAHAFESDNCNVVFFPFPDDEETCHAWVLRSGRHDLLNRTVEEIHLTEFLCERHFEEHHLDRTGPVALKPKAKPSVFEHDISQFAAVIDQGKSEGVSVSPDIVVIPCVIMDAGVNTEVIGYNGESVKEDSIDRADIERELQLIHEGEYVGNNEGIDVHQQVIHDLQHSVEDTAMLDPDTLVVDSIHAVDSSEWQEDSLTNLASQLCRICANENIEMISIFEEQSVQLQIIDKIQWHLPVVIKEDDKLPLKVCTNCVSLLNSWHELVTTCVEADAKLRKLFKIDEPFDHTTSVYCDLNSASPDETLESNVTTMQTVLHSSALVTRSDGQNVVPLDEISLQATDDSMGLEISKEPQLSHRNIPKVIEFFSETKEIQEKTIMRTALQNNISVNPLALDNVSSNSQFTDECTHSNEAQDTLCTIKEEPYSEQRTTVVTLVSQALSQSQEGCNEQQKSVILNITEALGNEETPDSLVKGRKEEPEEIEIAVCIEEQVEDEDVDDIDGDEEEEEEEDEAADEGVVTQSDEKLYCKMCGFGTTKKRNLHQHIARKHSFSMVACAYCDKMFTNELSKRIHERGHAIAGRATITERDAITGRDTSAAFVCEYCGRAFRSKKTLKEHHIAHHSDDRPFKCDKCDKNYGSLSSLDIHRATHSSETPYLCDLCGKTFKHVSNLRSHKRSHLDESDKNRQICQKCGKGFRSRFHLSEHMNVHDGHRPYSCDICGKRFHKKIQLRQHGSAHSGTQPYKCPICGVKFNRRGNMTQHVKRHNQERKYTCRVCNEAFPTLGAVLNHRKRHSDLEVQRSLIQHEPCPDDPDEAAFKCTVCGKLLAKKESLSIHMRSHTGEKLYPCPECGKRLSNKGSLTYHMRSFHTGERPHCCQFCGDGFLSKEARLVHERIHTGEKPYECLVCGMAFRCSSNLAQHARVHSNARPHPCLTCGKRFQRKGALDVHMRTHTGERPYACDICGRAFTQKNDMLKHRRTHTHEKPYHCDTCGCIFAQKKDLVKHRTSKHPAEAAGDASAVAATAVTVVPVDVSGNPGEDCAEAEEMAATQTVVITTTADNLLAATFPEITVPGIEHAQTVILQRF